MTRRPYGGLAPGAKYGAGGVRSSGGPGGCGSRHPGTREPAWASQALGERGGASFGKRASRVLPSDSGSGFGMCVCSRLPQDPRLGTLGGGGAIIGPTTACACAFRWLLNLRACRILFGNLASSLSAAQRQGWEDSSGQQRGPSLWTSGRTCRVALCRPRRERSSVPELYFKDPPPTHTDPSHSV